MSILTHANIAQHVARIERAAHTVIAEGTRLVEALETRGLEPDEAASLAAAVEELDVVEHQLGQLAELLAGQRERPERVQ